MSRTNNCRTVMYTLPQIYMCKVWKLSLVVVVQKLYVGLGVYNQSVLIFQQEGWKCCQITSLHCSLCKILSTRLLRTCCFPFQCCALLTFAERLEGKWGSQKNLKPRWPPASFFNHRPVVCWLHKQATSQCWFLQATWEPASFWPGFFWVVSWAWLPDLLGTT